MISSRKTDLADPASALASYLDDLLHIATDAARTDEAETETAGRQPPAPAARPSPSAPVGSARPVASPERPKVMLPVSAPVEPAPMPVARPTEMPTPAPEPPAKSPDDGEPAARPDWSEQPFECLIFRVAGLQLAVPLILLGAIHRLEQEVKPLPGSPRWYMGILPNPSQNLRVVDSAEWIMAGRVPAGARDNYRFVIRLDNSEWALACDDVAQSFTLNPSEVRWRTSRSKRPWLAGTVVSHMCALIDVGTMAQLLARAEREHHLRLE